MVRGPLTFLSIAVFLVLTGAVIYCVGFTGKALVEANDKLGVVDTELTSVGGHADPLTYQVQKVNSSLDSIQSALQPIHGQADTLNGILTGVNTTLTSADGTVKSINSLAGQIEPHLISSDKALGLEPGGEAFEVGPANATKGVAFLAGAQLDAAIAALTPAEQDLANVEGNLSQTNDHLKSACDHLGLTNLLNLLSLNLGGILPGPCN